MHILSKETRGFMKKTVFVIRNTAGQTTMVTEAEITEHILLTSKSRIINGWKGSVGKR